MPRLRSAYLHVIPLEDDDFSTSSGKHEVVQRHSRSYSEHTPGELLARFDAASHSVRDACVRVIEREAAQVNRRALQLKRSSSPTHDAPSSSKRRRTTTSLASPEATAMTDQVKLQEQSSRMMRMAVLLRNYEAIVAQLRPELEVCVAGGDEERGP